MRWQVQPIDPKKTERLSRELNLTPLVARLLVRRGIEGPDVAARFLHPTLDELHDPFSMADMRTAVERLRRAVELGEKILIYGDYDVDGSMAVVVLLAALRSLGAKVEAHIPHRLSDGYGMRVPVIERAAAESVRVVLSVDTGVREFEAIVRARELGLDCIVADHHLPDSRLPAAYAILNPRRADCGYPDKNLSGVGVTFKLVQALLGSRFTKRMLESYLKVVAIGTIADVVPLVGENRVIAHFGLAGLSSSAGGGRGLAALLAVAGLEGRTITATDVAFRIAPRLNAAGRMEDARDVIELLTTNEASKAREIAERLERLNRDRQRVEEETLREIAARTDRQPELTRRYSLVFWGEGWHRGVIGIVAQRVVDRFHRPALVIGVEGGIGVGSGRSIKGFNLLGALEEMKDLFERFGGHAQAAGFTLPAERIAELESRFEASARAALAPEDLEAVLSIDAEVELEDVDRNLYEVVRGLEPFGFGNPKPVFAARGVELELPPRVLQNKHLKLRVGQGAVSFDALGWRLAGLGSNLSAGRRLDLAFTLDENVFRDVATLQLIIKDFQVSMREVSSAESGHRKET